MKMNRALRAYAVRKVRALVQALCEVRRQQKRMNRALRGKPYAVRKVRALAQSLVYDEASKRPAFVALETFYCDAFSSLYVKGQAYFVRDAVDETGRPVEVTPLQEAMAIWQLQEKIELIGD